MGYFFYKLIPPRPTFAGDMTPSAWGMAVVETDNDAEARALGVDDPTIKAAAGFRFEAYPMPAAILRESPSP